MSWWFTTADLRGMPRRTLWLGLFASAVVGRGLAGLPAMAHATGACAEPSHRFESFALHTAELGRAKRIIVHLPPDYECAVHRRYPVFYLHDGHDLFDWNPFAADLDPALAAEIALREAWYGSWQLDAQLDQAIATGQLPGLIVVGIASDDGMRSRDLAPVPWEGSAEARGPAYGDFVAGTVVDAIDARYRTVAERRCRGIGGASLGAISALQLGLAHAGRFALVLALSPVLGESALADYVAAAWARADPTQPSTFLLDFDDDRIGAADRAWFRALLRRASNPAQETILLQSQGGRHAIASWAARVLPAMLRLVSARCAGRAGRTAHPTALPLFGDRRRRMGRYGWWPARPARCRRYCWRNAVGERSAAAFGCRLLIRSHRCRGSGGVARIEGAEGGAGEGNRTLDTKLGKLLLYH